MQFDGDSVIIGLDMSMDEISEFEAFIRPRLEYLETIEIEEGAQLHSSALLSLLVSLKKTKPDLKIPFLSLGMFQSNVHGTLHWIQYD